MNLRQSLLLSALAFSMTFAGCAFKNNEGRIARDNRLNEENEQSRQRINAVAGVWVGTLQRGNTQVPIRVEIVALPTDTGNRTSDGDTIFRYDPVATLTSSIDTRYTATFKGNYNDRTGELQLTNTAPAQNRTSDDLWTLNVTYDASAKTLNGSLRAIGYLMGGVTLTRETTQNAGNSIDEEVRQNEILHEQLRRVEGSWQGQLTRGTTKYPVALDVNISTSDTGQRSSNGSILNRYEPVAILKSEEIRYNGSLRGNFDDRQSELSLVNPSATQPDDVARLVLTVNGEEMKGTLYAKGYVVGVIEFKRTNQGPSTPIDEEDRLNEIRRQQLKKVVGFFYGTAHTSGGDCIEYNVCVNVILQEQRTPRGGFAPFLTGYYYREDLTPGNLTGERNLSVSLDYLNYPKTLVMTSRDMTTQPRPSPLVVTLTGKLNADDTVFTGTHLIENLSQQGPIELHKVDACPKRPNPGRCVKHSK